MEHGRFFQSYVLSYVILKWFGSNCLVDQRIVEAPTKTSSYNAVLGKTQRIRSKTARIVSPIRKYDVLGVGGLPFYVLELFYITLGTVRIDLHY